MPIYQLTDDVNLFPPPHCAEPGGLLALGGDLTPERLLAAYYQGIFPWYEEGQPILWWSPEPRLILRLSELKVSRSLKKVLKKGMYQVRYDTAFAEVIHACGETRQQKGEGTWITKDMEDAYIRLHQLGYAHSIESWFNGQLVGGLYGVFLGKCFFGESMFSTMNDSSKVAFVTMVEMMKEWNVHFIDCQVSTPHLIRLGAKEVSRTEFLEYLAIGLKTPATPGKWTEHSPQSITHS